MVCGQVNWRKRPRSARGSKTEMLAMCLLNLQSFVVKYIVLKIFRATVYFLAYFNLYLVIIILSIHIVTYMESPLCNVQLDGVKSMHSCVCGLQLGAVHHLIVCMTWTMGADLNLLDGHDSMQSPPPPPPPQPCVCFGLTD